MYIYSIQVEQGCIYSIQVELGYIQYTGVYTIYIRFYFSVEQRTFLTLYLSVIKPDMFPCLCVCLQVAALDKQNIELKRRSRVT